MRSTRVYVFSTSGTTARPKAHERLALPACPTAMLRLLFTESDVICSCLAGGRQGVLGEGGVWAYMSRPDISCTHAQPTHTHTIVRHSEMRRSLPLSAKLHSLRFWSRTCSLRVNPVLRKS